MRKHLVIVPIAFLFSVLICGAQSRVAGLDPEKVSSIRILMYDSITDTLMKSVDEPARIGRIISFLKSVKYDTFRLPGEGWREAPSDRIFRILFDGWRDEISLFTNSAFVGKSTFSIDTGVVRRFRSLIDTM